MQAVPIRSTQTILLAIVVGMLTLTGAMVFLRPGNERPMNPEVARLLPVAIAGLLVCEGVVYGLLRRQTLARVSATKAEALALVQQDRMPAPLQVLAIIGGALAEGVGLLGAITIFLGGPWYVLAAPALAIACMLALLPSRARVETLLRELPG